MKRVSNRPLDSFDRKILAIVQRDNLTAQREISQQINLSPAAVHRRIRRLHDNGIITGNVAVVKPAAVGRPLTIIAEVSVDSERESDLDKLKNSFVGSKEVQQCYYVTGDADFVLVINVVDMDDYERLTRRLFFANPNVRRFRTMVAMKVDKASLAVPV